jgi:hypothetical protein
MAITVDTNFPTGVLGTIEDRRADRVQARLYRERAADGVNTQATWFHARLTGVEQPSELVLTGLHDVYNGQPGAHSIDERDKPVLSLDGRTWQRVSAARFDRAAETLTIPLPVADELWVAMLEPYGPAELATLEQAVRECAWASTTSVGATVEGRPLPCWTIGDPGAPRAVWLMARQHAWETHTSWCLEGAVRWLLGPGGQALASRCVCCVLPMMDPDGVERGATRVNRHGFDLNRHWQATDPDDAEHRRLRPEVCAAKAATRDWLAHGRPVDVHLNLHDTQRDVMEAPRAVVDAPVLRGLHERMVASGYSGPLRAGGGGQDSVEHGLHAEFGLVAALIELGTAEVPTMGGSPSAAQRAAFGADLARALAELLG